MKDKYCPEKCVSFPDNTKKRCCKNEFCNISRVYNTTSSKIGVQRGKPPN